MKKSLLMITVVVAILFLSTNSSFAQFNGHNTKGDFGLQSASQPDPGFYLIAPLYLRFQTDTLKDSNGDPVLPDERGSLGVNAYVLGFYYVSEFEIFGANYGFQAYPAWTNNNLEVPIFGVDQETSTSFTDLYLQPINLGWHTQRADFTAGFGVYAPTGKYEFGANGNIGLGMWSFELFGGTTLFFDEAKTWHFATTAFYETHTDKRDTDIHVGDLLTLEGGLGWSFLEGAASVGVAYYAQWKVTHDDLGSLDVVLDELFDTFGLPPRNELPVGKHRVYGVGPELSFPIATKKKLYALLNVRYLREFGARTSLEGSTFVVTATFPIPSVPLQ